MDPGYRILLLGDYSNLHAQLARTLRALGHDVTVMSAGAGFQDTNRDIDVSRRPGKIGGALLTARCLWPLHRYMRGYDIVQLCNPNFLSLRPRRLRYLFDRLCGENGAVFLSAAGTDVFYIRECLDPASPLRYNEYRVGSRPAPYALEQPRRLARWQTPEMVDLARHVYDNLAGVTSALYEYHLAARRGIADDKIGYCGIPVDTEALPFKPIDPDTDCVRLFLGRHRGRLAEKGTDLLETAARNVVARHPGHVSLQIVENVPYRRYVDTMTESHIMLDQVYSYSPATNALIGMSRGLCAVTGGEDDYYRFIGEHQNRPILNALPDVDALTQLLEDAVSDTHALAERGRRSRELVVRHNDTRVVTRRYLDFWASKL